VLEGQAAIARRDTQAVQAPLACQSAIAAGMAGVGGGITRHSAQSGVVA